MHSTIFSSIQAQANSQLQPLLPEMSPQENSGTMPGIFDALITEYSLTENQSPEITNTHESSQPATFTNSNIFSGRIAEISQPENESMPQITENKSTWRNLFVDVRRNPEITTSKHENFSPQNDFDDGITIAASKVVDADFDTHNLPHEAKQTEPKNEPDNAPDYSENVTEKREPSAENSQPDELPTKENVTPRKEPSKNDKAMKPGKQSAEIAQPVLTDSDITEDRQISRPHEIAEPSKNENVTETLKPSAEVETPETEKPAKVPESPKTAEPITRESPEISGENIIMAGLAPLPPEISQTPETDSTPKNLRSQVITRKSQAVTREAENAVSFTDSESLTDDSRIITPTQSRTIQNEGGDSEARVPESTQPSESHDIGETPRVRITNQPARNSRTTQRTESRNDTRRTEALSDFQAFFEGVNRVKRSPARVSTQPLSLRTATYEADSTPTQSQTLRNGIVNTIRFIRADGVRKANIIVDPPALGRISVELTSSSSGVEASVKVANEQIRQIVQDQFIQLRDNLLQQGVQVSEFTVDVQQDNSRQGQDSGGQNHRDAYTFTPSEDDDDTEIFMADLEEGLLYWIA